MREALRSELWPSLQMLEEASEASVLRSRTASLRDHLRPPSRGSARERTKRACARSFEPLEGGPTGFNVKFEVVVINVHGGSLVRCGGHFRGCVATGAAWHGLWGLF